MWGLRSLRRPAFEQLARNASPLTVPVDVCVGDDLAFADQALHDLPDNIIELLVRVAIQVIVHMRFPLAALDEGYLILLRHGAFYGDPGAKDPCSRNFLWKPLPIPKRDSESNERW